jgi:hypothetical protein
VEIEHKNGKSSAMRMISDFHFVFMPETSGRAPMEL